MRKLYKSSEADNLNEVVLALGYEEISRKKFITDNLVTIEYKKKEGINYPHLEREYMIRSFIPFISVIIPLVIALILVTTYLFLNICIKGDFDKLLYFYILMLPGFLMIIVASGISLWRYFSLLHNLKAVAALPLIKKEIDK